MFDRWMVLLLVAAFGAVGTGCSEPLREETRPDDGPMRVVVLGGDVAEIVYALGAGDQVVGADQSSTYPPEVREVARLNYHRQVSPEGVLSLEPDLVLLTQEAGPPGAVEQLRSAANVVTIPSHETAEGVPEKMRAVAAALGLEEEGERLVANYERDLAAVRERVARYGEKPSVLFLYARQGMGAPMVGGKDSGAHSMIELAGGRNAAGKMEGYRALTPEALLEFDPAWVLMMSKGFEAIGGAAGLLAMPGMGETEAGRNRNFLVLDDDLLLTFGPRTPEAVARLAEALHVAGEGEAK